MKKICFFLFFIFSFSRVCFAVTLLVEQEALKVTFPEEGLKITEKKITLSWEQLQEVKKSLGGNLTHFSKNKEAQQINNQKEFIFYLAEKDASLIGVALILEEPGAWGPIRFMVRVSPTSKVENVLVMKYSEIRGRPISSKDFLSQFIGKTLKAPLKIGVDVDGVSGATISSEGVSFTVKKALVMCDLLIFKKGD